MISRVAGSCFWLTRFLERIHTMAQLLEVQSAFSVDVDLPSAERWRPLVIVAGQEEDFLQRIGEQKIEDAEAVQEYLTWDADQPCSIFSSLRGARENARTIREVMSVEMWESLNDCWLWMKSRSARRLYDRDRGSFYRRFSTECMLLHGISYSTMLHEEPFVFMKLGRAVERVGQTARVLDVKHHALGEKPREEESSVEAAQWLVILRSCSGQETFFKRAAKVLTGAAVADFLIFDRTFPRSVLHNLDRARGLMMRLREGDPPGMERRSWEMLERFRGCLLQMDIDDVRHMGMHEALTWIVDTTAELCTSIHDDYLDSPLETLRERVQEGRLAGEATAAV